MRGARRSWQPVPSSGWEIEKMARDRWTKTAKMASVLAAGAFGLTAALGIGYAASAGAADFTERYYDGVDVPTPNDDPRDADRYGDRSTFENEYGDPGDDDNAGRRFDERYSDRYAGRAPYDGRQHGYGSFKDDPGPLPYAYRDNATRYREADAWRHAPHYRCVSRHAVKRRLKRGGWHRLARGERRGDIVHVYASRYRAPGRFKLAVDRCSGDVVSVVRVNARYGVRQHAAWRDRVWNQNGW